MKIRATETAFLIRLEAGEEVIATLRSWAQQEQIGFAWLQAIGAMDRATLSYFDAATKTYHDHPVDEQVEVLSLAGNLSWGKDGAPVVHAHAVLSRADGNAIGGHVMEGYARPMLEIMLWVLPTRVERRRDEASGLALWDL